MIMQRNNDFLIKFGEPMNPRDRTIIDFVQRYRLATNRVIGTQLLAGVSENAVTKVTARLCSIGWLSRHMLVPPECYFRLGPAAISTFGLSARLCEPLGPQVMPIEYATLIYATQTNNPRRRLTVAELQTTMPWLGDDLAHAPYCLDGQGRLDLVRVDLGGSPRHVVRKTLKAIEARLAVPQFQDLAIRSRFQVAILTTTTEKANAISQAIQTIDTQPGVRIHLAVVPQLSALLLRTH